MRSVLVTITIHHLLTSTLTITTFRKSVPILCMNSLSFKASQNFTSVYKMCTCNYLIRRQLNSLAYLQLEIKEERLHTFGMDPDLRSNCLQLQRSSEPQSERPMETETTLDLGNPKNPSESSSEMPTTQQGVGVQLQNSRPEDVKYICRLCKILVSGTKYRGLKILGFENFSKHMIDVHRKNVVGSYPTKAGGRTDDQWTKSTGAILDTMTMNKKETTSPTANPSQIPDNLLHRLEIAGMKCCSQADRISEELNNLRQYLDLNFNATRRTVRLVNTSTQTDTELKATIPDYVSTGVQYDLELSQPDMVDKDHQTVTITETDLHETPYSGRLDQLQRSQADDMDSEDESSIIDVCSTEDETIQGISILPQPPLDRYFAEVDVDSENDEELDVALMEVEIQMRDQNTVSVTPFLIEKNRAPKRPSTLAFAPSGSIDLTTNLNHLESLTNPSQNPTSEKEYHGVRSLPENQNGNGNPSISNQHPHSLPSNLHGETRNSNTALESEIQMTSLLKVVEDYLHVIIDEVVSEVDRSLKRTEEIPVTSTTSTCSSSTPNESIDEFPTNRPSTSKGVSIVNPIQLDTGMEPCNSQSPKAKIGSSSETGKPCSKQSRLKPKPCPQNLKSLIETPFIRKSRHPRSCHILYYEEENNRKASIWIPDKRSLRNQSPQKTKEEVVFKPTKITRSSNKSKPSLDKSHDPVPLNKKRIAKSSNSETTNISNNIGTERPKRKCSRKLIPGIYAETNVVLHRKNQFNSYYVNLLKKPNPPMLKRKGNKDPSNTENSTSTDESSSDGIDEDWSPYPRAKCPTESKKPEFKKSIKTSNKLGTENNVKTDNNQNGTTTKRPRYTKKCE